MTARILLVDDDLDVLGSHARFLRVSGHDVVIADSAESGLMRLETESVDIVVTDLRMPGQNGLDFAREARARQPLVPILFFSGFARIPEVVAAMRLGAVDFLEKPIEPSLLLAAIERLSDEFQQAGTRSRDAFVAPPEGTPLRLRVRAYERYLIETALQRHDGSIAKVLDTLQISRRTLNDKMARLGIRRREP